jgi:hypothetical protein
MTAILTIDPKILSPQRIQLHYAIQFMAATGAALMMPQPDYSHTTLDLGWRSPMVPQ